MLANRALDNRVLNQRISEQLVKSPEWCLEEAIVLTTCSKLDGTILQTCYKVVPTKLTRS